MFASPSASCYPEWERQETAETWDFQTFSESDAAGEGEESVPTPRLKQTGSACLGPEQPPPLMNASASANPKGFGGLLAYLPQNPSGSTLPGGSITHGLVLAGYGDGGWEFSSWQPGMCKTLGFHSPRHSPPQTSPTSGCLLITLSLPQLEKFPSPRTCSERQRLPNTFTQRFVSLGIFPSTNYFRQKFQVTASAPPSFSSCATAVWDWNYLKVGFPSKHQEEEGRNAIHYLLLILFIRYKGATGSQTDIWANMFKGSAII